MKAAPIQFRIFSTPEGSMKWIVWFNPRRSHCRLESRGLRVSPGLGSVWNSPDWVNLARQENQQKGTLLHVKAWKERKGDPGWGFYVCASGRIFCMCCGSHRPHCLEASANAVIPLVMRAQNNWRKWGVPWSLVRPSFWPPAVAKCREQMYAAKAHDFSLPNQNNQASWAIMSNLSREGDAEQFSIVS